MIKSNANLNISCKIHIFLHNCFRIFWICFSISSGFVIGWSEYIGNFFYMILSFVDGWFRESVMARLIPNRHSYLYSSMSSKLLSKGLHSRLKNSNIIRKQIESINPSRIRRKCKMSIQYISCGLFILNIYSCIPFVHWCICLCISDTIYIECILILQFVFQ